ncbi:MAG: DNA cytosine methyltransferase [Cellulomonadaceae bacterium]|nr:DNA cytosine methyltransferase [Cellulomonadaceae bacterium]
MMNSSTLTSVEICAGAGGQALGLEMAGFSHELAVEIDPTACDTLRANRPEWTVHEGDIREVDGRTYDGVDLLAGGVPCPPFSVAGKQLGSDDERDLFPEALRLIREAKPRAVMLENVKGLTFPRFATYREQIRTALHDLGYETHWQLIYCSEYGVPQLRPRFILVGLRSDDFSRFHWPAPIASPPTVGHTLHDLVASHGWIGADRWAFEKANSIAPTIVGGSKKHGGADLGPTRAREQWKLLGVDGRGIANDDDFPNEVTHPDALFRLTVRMGARIQGFPDSWQITGRKTAAWRTVGNAFPPPVARAIGLSIHRALSPRTVDHYAAESAEFPAKLSVR